MSRSARDTAPVSQLARDTAPVSRSVRDTAPVPVQTRDFAPKSVRWNDDLDIVPEATRGTVLVSRGIVPMPKAVTSQRFPRLRSRVKTIFVDIDDEDEDLCCANMHSITVFPDNENDRV